MPAKPPPARPRPPRTAGRRALRTVLWTLLAAVLLAAAGHSALWWTVGGRLEDGFSAWAAARRAEGWRVEHGAPRRGGWPFAATLAVPDFRLRGSAGGLPGGVDWRPEAPLVLRVAPPRLDRLAVEASGRHRLDLGGAALRFSAGSLRLAVPVDPTAAPREGVAAAARGLRFDTPSGPVSVRAATLDYGAEGGGAEAAETALRVAAAAVSLPPGLPGADRLGNIVERVGLDLLLAGALPPPGRDPARRAAAWRDRGGALEVRSFEAVWGEAAVSVSATLALDDALQPAGTGTLAVSGGEALLEAAGRAGLLSPLAATAARFALRSLNRAPPEGGGPARAEAPLALKDRSLTVGGWRVARVPALEWGGRAPEGD